MSTTFAPFVEANITDSTDVFASTVRPVSSFLKPTLTSWINAPYYNVPANLKPAAVAATAEAPVENLETPVAVKEAAEEAAPAPAVTVPVATARQYLPTVPDTVVLEGFDVNKLSPDLQEVVAESHITHVQTVIRFLQKGGEGAKTFGKIFLNDLALQRSILSDLMGESSNALSQLDSLQRELALRLAACVQARQVAQLLLVDV
ncbi:MAG: hypothetical protein KGS72_01445 [Cyanobacteria bacterium REEB67]|nr:hypothetical protein [Cyanobacteria bacterium REEB67]